MHLKDTWDSYFFQGGSTIVVSVEHLHDTVIEHVFLTQNQKWVKIMLKLLMSDFNAFAFLLLLYNHRVQVGAMTWRARDIFFCRSKISGVNFWNVLLAQQHLSSSFSSLSLRLNILEQCLSTKGNEKSRQEDLDPVIVLCNKNLVPTRISCSQQGSGGIPNGLCNYRGKDSCFLL